MEELHTIVDLSDPDEIRRGIDACATRCRPDISLSTARASRSWARVTGPRRNMEDGGGEAGRSCLSVSTDRV